MTEATRRQMGVATLIWMVAVALSRVMGLLREMVIARMAGADGHTDVYFTAFNLPDIVNNLVAGGTLSVTFIPIFLGFMIRKEEERGWKVFNTVFQVSLGVLALLLTIAWIFAPYICRRWLAPGFDMEQHQLLVRFTRILLPAQLFFFAGGLFGAVQMARGRHAFYAAAPLIYNAGIIAGGLLLAPRLGMEGFCWGALAGAVVGHGVLQFIGAWRSGLRLQLRFTGFHPAVRHWMALTLPFILGQSILATDNWIQRYLGSGLSPASISWLNYGRNLMLVLPAILGQAAAVASFPLLARQAEQGELGLMRSTLTRALERSLLLSGFGAVVLIVLNREVVQLAYGRGAFTTSDVLTTGHVLAILALAAPALVAQAIVARGYYALRDTWTPTIIGTLITLGALPLYVYLSRWFDNPGFDRGGGHVGLAWASAGSLVLYGFLTILLLQRGLDRRDPAAGKLIPGRFLLKCLPVLLVTLVIAALVRGAVGGWLPDMAFLPAIGRSVLVGSVALLVFIVGCRLAGFREVLAPVAALLGRFGPKRVAGSEKVG
ncbi:MAG TPA: murein biosynthesis integral membrane protein MurJ [Candidatus Eisenbacteria bacterium]